MQVIPKGYWSVGAIRAMKDFIENIMPYMSLNSWKITKKNKATDISMG